MVFFTLEHDDQKSGGAMPPRLKTAPPPRFRRLCMDAPRLERANSKLGVVSMMRVLLYKLESPGGALP